MAIDPNEGRSASHDRTSVDPTAIVESSSVDPGMVDARPLLPKAAFFLGDLRDGLPMINMQAAYLISSKNFTEKQVGLLFLAFGMSQFLCMAPAGYFLDYSNRKIFWVNFASVAIAGLTMLSTLTAREEGRNMMVMLMFGVVQGGLTSILPPGFNGITMGIVGSTGFTYQVSRNRMMNHMGTALVVAFGSCIAYYYYPNLGALFLVSPLAAVGVCWHLRQIVPNHVNRDAARALILESPTMNEYELADDVAECKQRAADLLHNNVDDETNSSASGANGSISSSGSRHGSHSLKSPVPSTVPGMKSDAGEYQPPDLLLGLDPPTSISTPISTPHPSIHGAIDPRARRGTPVVLEPNPLMRSGSADEKKSYNSMPSFNFAVSKPSAATGGLDKGGLRARTPLAVLMDPTLLIFTTVIFFFHLANSSVLPLVMQSLALQDPQAGILLSGLCILIAQGFMAMFAKICGDYSPIWGRKNLILAGLLSLTLRCFCLTVLITTSETVETERGSHILKALILSTQFLDSVGAGILGTLQILVTSDISGGTGRFSLLLGVTTAAMCLGATVSGYLGQALAQDYGYSFAFAALGIISLIPFGLYVSCMPETLPDYARPQEPRRRRRRLREILRRLNEQRRSFMQSVKGNPFRASFSGSVNTKKQQVSPVDSKGSSIDQNPILVHNGQVELV